MNKVKCELCGDEISKGDSFHLNGKLLCEDCYIDEKMTVKACNPLSIRSAKIIEEISGKSAEESLSDLQKNLLNYIKENNGATKKELSQSFELSEREVENQFAILRHCELVKAKKINEKIYLVPF